MKLRRKSLFLCLLWGLTLVFGGCGAAQNPELDQLSSLSSNFSAQTSVTCTVQYTACFDAVIDGVAYTDLQHSCVVDAQADLTSGVCQALGEMVSTLGEDIRQVTEVETYGDSAESYCRYGECYAAESLQDPFFSLIQLPLSLDFSQGFQAQDATQILYGEECTVFTGTRIADDTPQYLFFCSEPDAGFSLDGCLVGISLFVSNSTGLPGCIKLDYSNLDQLEPTCTDPSGNQFILTSLRYQINYRQYGTQVSLSLPEEFREAALGSSLDLTDSFAGVLEYSQASDHQTPAATERDPESEEDGVYRLTDSGQTYCYEISTPASMELESRSENDVSFSYYYGPDDYELVSYSLCQGFTHQQGENYAKSLPDFYSQTEGISQVSSSGVHSITLGEFQVWYIAIELTMAQQGQSYQVLDLYSWMEAPNGQDCLEVTITEYNGSGDGIMLDPEEELEYAYGAIGYIENQP